MNIDTYTKAVLTVIAVCLVVICVRDIRFVGEAQAAGNQVEITGWSAGTLGVQIETIAPLAARFGPLPVRIVGVD